MNSTSGIKLFAKIVILIITLFLLYRSLEFAIYSENIKIAFTLPGFMIGLLISGNIHAIDENTMLLGSIGFYAVLGFIIYRFLLKPLIIYFRQTKRQEPVE